MEKKEILKINELDEKKWNIDAEILYDIRKKNIQNAQNKSGKGKKNSKQIPKGGSVRIINKSGKIPEDVENLFKEWDEFEKELEIKRKRQLKLLKKVKQMQKQPNIQELKNNNNADNEKKEFLEEKNKEENLKEHKEIELKKEGKIKKRLSRVTFDESSFYSKGKENMEEIIQKDNQEINNEKIENLKEIIKDDNEKTIQDKKEESLLNKDNENPQPLRKWALKKASYTRYSSKFQINQQQQPNDIPLNEKLEEIIQKDNEENEREKKDNIKNIEGDNEITKNKKESLLNKDDENPQPLRKWALKKASYTRYSSKFQINQQQSNDIPLNEKLEEIHIKETEPS